MCKVPLLLNPDAVVEVLRKEELYVLIYCIIDVLCFGLDLMCHVNECGRRIMSTIFVVFL